jgi:amino acid adenylation domain-containing protein
MTAPALQGFAISPEQHRTWLQQEADGAAARYRAECAVAVSGLAREQVSAALADAARRHEILRTRLERMPGLLVPVQVIAAAAETTLEVFPWLGDEEASLAAALAQLREPADAAVMRAGWVEGPHRSVLCLSLPALLADAGTLRVLAEELARTAGGAASPPADPPLQYADVAAWLNELGESARGAGTLAEGGPAEAGLPWNAPAGSPFEPRSVRAPLPSALVNRIRRLAAEEKAPVAAVFLACWQASLARLTGQADVVVGVAVEARRFPELAGALGPLTRHLPVRVTVDLERSFREVLREAGDALRAAGNWEAYCRWQGAAAVATAFSCEEPAGDGAAEAGPMTMLRSHAHPQRFTLELAVRLDGAPELALHYDAACVEAAEAARLARQLVERLGRVADETGGSARRLLRPSDAERVRLTADWNRTQAAYAAPLTLHGLFEAQVRRDPQAVAAVFEGRRLTFEELNRRANRLAHRLRRMGVGVDVPVLLCGERSLERLVSTLAVLKAGGGFVPLDPANPPERLGFMIEDTRSPLALADGRALAILRNHGVPVLALDAEEVSLAGESAADPPEVARPESLAYVIYTSGSTGRPKGVIVPHAAIVNRILWGQDVYPLGAEDRVLQSAAFGFDFSVWETFAPLAAGATVVLPRPDGHRDAAYLARLIAEAGVTTAHFVPSMLKVFLDEPGVERCRSLRRVFCGGEALPASLARQFFEVRPDTLLYNQYGPTETTVDSTFHLCAPADGADTVPIGRPVANTTVYVLDADLELAPEGTVGELCIGGAGLARGYLGRPDLTAAAFVPDPHGGAGGARLYRTGDLARQRTDGSLEFLGRRDQQVKVRGARIEAGEIESVLLDHPLVREAAVMALDGGAGESCLAAYLACDERAATADLREFLALRLPDYMVPSRFVRLPALPRTASGKVDRRALPALGTGARETAAVLAPPRTPLEERLAAIFADVLRLPQVGIHDDFFQLGGHSLLAMRLVSRVRESLARELPLRAVFETPTVAGLTTVIEAVGGDGGVSPVTRVPRGALPLAGLLGALEDATDVEAEASLGAAGSHDWSGGAGSAAVAAVEMASRLTPRKRRVLAGWLDQRGPELGVFPLSFAQERLWIFEQLFPSTHAYNVPVAVRLRGRLDVQALRRSLAALAARHEVLRTTFLEVDGRAFQVIAPAPCDGPVSFLETDLTGATDPEGEARTLATAAARVPFDLGRGPLLRAALYRLGGDDQVLLLVTHHIAFDGWSLGVLVEELAAAYRAFADGAAPHFPELTVQYADFAVWQRRFLDGPVFERQLAYWRDRLAQAPLTALPTDRQAPARARFAGGRESVSLSPELAARLRGLGPAEGATLFMTLLAAFAALVKRYTRQGEVTVLSSVANRDHLELERVVGFFVNLVALRLDVSSDPTFRELLARVRETTLGAYANQDVPFDCVVDAVRPARSFDQAPFSRLGFTLQGPGGGGPDFGALAVTPFEVEAGSAKTDLTLHVADDGEELLLSAEYNLDLFDRETVQRLLGHYATLLDSAGRTPDLPLSALAPDAGRDPLPLASARLGAPGVGPRAELAERSNLTLSQLLFWLGQKLQPASPIFNMVMTFAIEGAVDAAALAAAVEAVVGGSDALRTVVREVDGIPQQSVLPPSGAVLEHVDLTGAADPRSALEKWIGERSRRLVSLDSRPFEAALLGLGEEQSVLFLAQHHVIADGWSVALVWRQVAEAYERALAGTLQPLVLPAFQEFVQEERGFRRSRRYERAAAYWREKLARPLEPLPFYGHLPEGSPSRGRRLRCALGAARVARLRELAARRDLQAGTEDLTLSSFFGAALAAFLHQISGARRLSIGFVYHNRHTRRLAETIGMLIEILPLHLTVEEDETFSSLARKFAREALTVLKHGRHPIASPAQQRAWHAVLNYIGRTPLPALGSLPVEMEWVHTGHQDENLAVHVHPAGSSGDLVVDLDLDCDLFGTREAEEASGHVVELLDALLADPGRRLDEVGLRAREDEKTAALRKEVVFDF